MIKLLYPGGRSGDKGGPGGGERRLSNCTQLVDSRTCIGNNMKGLYQT